MRLIIDDVGEMNLIMMGLGLLKDRFKPNSNNFYFREAIGRLRVKVARCSDMTYVEDSVHEDVWWSIGDELYEKTAYVEDLLWHR